MNEKELNHFRQKLMEKRSELINAVQKSESYGREADGDGEAMDIVDKASSSYTKEFMFSLSNSDRQLIQMVRAALGRIDQGNYGECESCGEEVERKRLEAVPWARLCLKCQEREERRRA